MIGRVTLDRILRFVLTRMMNIAPVVHILRMHLHDPAGDPPGLRIPGHVITNPEWFFHGWISLRFVPIKQATSRRRNLALFIRRQVCDSVVAPPRQATGSRALLARLFGAINIVRCIDERDVGKCLRKIA